MKALRRPLTPGLLLLGVMATGAYARALDLESFEATPSDASRQGVILASTFVDDRVYVDMPAPKKGLAEEICSAALQLALTMYALRLGFSSLDHRSG